ncbi:DNA-binding response regulator [Actinosynnema sp. ALI-1.44]|uniref:response regulator n=1 Tax=Actinosynnema sp. ALI-1.44 TaxID=1933779 RepID=UPI00097BC8F4|nr:response regulator transcription factor [Actinosynnema sp. ALI-1.44]ONI73281.1 DNA-binding response regulator [Actinosynnema sp. ALI-1.44]
MIRVLLVDDQKLVRSGLRAILDGEDDIDVVGEAGDGARALRSAVELRPDVVLMDVKMPGMDGLAATRRILADTRCRGSKIVVLTTFDLDEYVYEALRLGASGFLLKDSDPIELIHGVRVVARGDAMLAPQVTARLIGEFAHRVRPARKRFDVLTEREREVMDLVAAGRSNDEIAAELVVSPATVKTHVSRILTKLGVRDRVHLVVLAHTT